MKVVHTPPRYAPHVGGVEAVAREVCERLRDRGDDVSVVCADEPPGAATLVNGVPIRRLRFPFKVANTNITPGLPVALARSGWDVVHTHLPTPWSADWSCLIANLMRRRSVLTFYNETVGSGPASVMARVYRHTLEGLTMRMADSILVQSESWKQRLERRRPHLAAKLHVIPNGVDTSRFSPPEEGPGLPDALLFVSVLDRFHRYKGLDVLLRALAVRREVPLTVVGDGHLRRHYEAMAGELRLEELVEFVGAMSDQELLSLYRSHGFFVLPSKTAQHEGGSSLVVLEAMACGMPVIAAKGAGDIAWQLAAADAGVCVSADDVQGLAAAIRRLTSDETRREAMSRAARDYVVTHHSWDYVVDRIREQYGSRP